MVRTRRLAPWVGALALATVAITGLAASNHATATAPTPAHRSDRVEAEVATVARPVHHASTLDERQDRTRPSLIWWVAALVTVLALAIAWLQATARPATVHPQVAWSGRDDRGPPAVAFTA